MSNEQENKKLNRLNINKETVSDLDIPQGQDVVGGGSGSPAQCIPSPSGGPIGDRACWTNGPQHCPGPIAAATKGFAKC